MANLGELGFPVPVCDRLTPVPAGDGAWTNDNTVSRNLPPQLTVTDLETLRTSAVYTDVLPIVHRLDFDPKPNLAHFADLLHGVKDQLLGEELKFKYIPATLETEDGDQNIDVELRKNIRGKI